MPILGIPLFFEGASLRSSSPSGVSILGIGISSRLVIPQAPGASGLSGDSWGLWRPLATILELSGPRKGQGRCSPLSKKCLLKGDTVKQATKLWSP
eukprot:873598-Pyramimonas_sp.AAC.1